MKKRIVEVSRRYWLLLVLIGLKMVLQLALVNPVYELHRDEFLHLGQANHLAYGFISVPPLTSWISVLIFWLGGNEFWVRFFPGLFGALTIVFAWLMVERLGGKLFSKLLVSGALIFSVMMRLNVLFQPNSFEILAWTMMFYFLVSYDRCKKIKWLIFLALDIVFGFYNKYTLIFPLTGFAISLFLFPQRRVFFTFSTILALIGIIVLLMPNILWQITHHFPVIHHMSRLKETQLDNNSALGFLKSQLMFFLGSLPLIIGALVGFIRFKPFFPYRFIGVGFLITLALFALAHAKDYYACGLYPAILVFGGVYMEYLLQKKWQIPVKWGLVCFNLMVFIGIAPYLMPVYNPASIIRHKKAFEKLGMLRWEDGKNHPLPQDFSDMLGWKEMAQKALTAFKNLPSNEVDQTLVFCDNYGETGALNYYNRGRMPEAYSFNTDYIYWLPKMSKIKNVLLVGEKPDEEVLNLFKQCIQLEEVKNEFAREKGTKIFLLKGATDQFTSIFYEMADKKKKAFDIF